MHDRRTTSAISALVVFLFMAIVAGLIGLGYAQHHPMMTISGYAIGGLVFGLFFLVRLINLFRREYDAPPYDDDLAEAGIMHEMRYDDSGSCNEGED